LFDLSMCLHGFVSLVTKESTRRDNKNSETKAKLGYSSFQNKIKLFLRHILSKTFCHFPNVRMRTNAFREEAFSDCKEEECKNKLQGYWRSSTPDLTSCRNKNNACIPWISIQP